MYTVPRGVEFTDDLVREAISYNDTFRDAYDNNYSYDYDELEEFYVGKHPILKRKKVPTLKNNKLIINHAKYITDAYTGYLMGNPVEYQMHSSADDSDNENKATDPKSAIEQAYRSQSISNHDSKLAKLVSVFGRAYEYTFANEDGELRTVSIDPRNCVIAYDDTFEHKKQFAVIYNGVWNENEKVYENVTVITKDEIIEYTSLMNEKERKPHYFGDVPVVEVLNNEGGFGDFEPVIPLIEAYNILQSDRVNDKEQLVDALLCAYGFDIPQSDAETAGRTRMLTNLPADGKMEYLTKSLKEADTEVLKKSITDDIHKISMVPNLADENFAGNSSGVAIRYKLLMFEQATKTKERFMEQGLKERWSIYNNYLVKKERMPIIPAHDIDAVFKRSLPQNDLETSQMIMNLSNIVDDATLLGQLSFVQDAEAVVEKKREEKEQNMNFQLPQFGSQEATDNVAEDVMEEESVERQKSLLDNIRTIIRG